MCRSQDYNNNTFLIKISSLTDEKKVNTVQILRKVYKSKLVLLLQYKLVPLPTSGVSHLLHEELRGKGVQNVTILLCIK